MKNVVLPSFPIFFLPISHHPQNIPRMGNKIDTYPIAILSMFVVIGTLMMIYVVPQLTAMLTELGGDLPITTKILIGISDFLRKWILLVIVAVIALILG